MNKRYTIDQFRKDYPDNDACLHRLFTIRYNNLICPKCDGDKEFTKVKTRMSYQCPSCGFQIYPMAGTVFEKSRTPLTHWFYAIYLQTTTRNGVAAKELERQLNVCYETALRMAHQIKKLMGHKKPEKLTGIVQTDETYVGGKLNLMNKKQRLKLLNADNTYKDNKTGLMGFISKDGKVRCEVMYDGKTFKDRVRNNVAKDAIIVTDNHSAYDGLNVEFAGHEIVNHGQGEYVREGWTTNQIESFFSQLKRTIKGTHIHCSVAYLQLYADECAFRHMHRERQDEMFNAVLSHVV
jgi:transposase